MSILDAIIIICLIIGIMGGFRRGLIKEVILLGGLVISVIISFMLRVPISTFFYKTLPFFSFGGLFKGVTIINILLYEVIAFLIVFSISYLVLRILLKISGIIEKILKATIILGIFSKIAGGIVGFIESYIIVFICLFIFSQPFFNTEIMEHSKLPYKILDNTPILSDAIEDTRIVVDKIYDLAKKYKSDKDKFNDEAIELFLKYEIITEENLELLKEKGKIDY